MKSTYTVCKYFLFVLLILSGTSSTLSATGLSVVDLSTPPGAYSQVVSIVDKSGIVSSLQLTIYIQENAHPLSPLGKLQANVSQIQLYIPVPFVISTVVRMSNDTRNVQSHFY